MPAGSRAEELTYSLHLTARNRRPAGDWLLIGGEFEELVRAGATQAKAKAEIAEKYEIDERTAKRYWCQFVEAKAIHDSIE